MDSLSDPQTGMRSIKLSSTPYTLDPTPNALTPFHKEKSRPRKCERLSGELLGLTRGCDLRKEGVTVT
jgi:hypothetical protein